MSARTARRRRKQAANGMNHLAKLGRPIYPTGPGTQEARAKREQRWRENRKKTGKG